MPKKTKRQKIAAQLHKRPIHYTAVEPASPQIVTVNKHEQTHIVSQPRNKMLFDSSTDIFKSELKKSVIISVALVLLEIGIYIGQTNGMSLTMILPF